LDSTANTWSGLSGAGHAQEALPEIERGAEWLERSYIGAAVHIDATFFNTGTGDLNDDVGGHIAQGFGTDFRRIE